MEFKKEAHYFILYYAPKLSEKVEVEIIVFGGLATITLSVPCISSFEKGFSILSCCYLDREFIFILSRLALM